MNGPIRFIGISLSGAKNLKTAIASIDYYPREKKVFLLELYDRITPREHQSSDQSILEILSEISTNVQSIGINASFTLPPCIDCTRKTCPLPQRCTVPSVRWMRDFSKKTYRDGLKDLRDFTPYTQRPCELWIQNSALPSLSKDLQFEVDETLGGNRAPLTARLHFLKRHLRSVELLETSPKLTLARLGLRLGLPRRLIAAHRKLEEGAHARELILEHFMKRASLFIYDRDLHQMAQSLNAFDAFFCAYMALLHSLGDFEKPPKGFPAQSGWIYFPEMSLAEE